MAGTRSRRPVSRRLMMALFVLMIVPVCGWYFIGDLASRRLLQELPRASHEQILSVQHEIRFKLAITLGLSIVALGSVIVYVRRTLLDPLEHLAVSARRSAEQWEAPPELSRQDEVGDLARALDSSLTRLRRRADEAEQLAANLSHELRSPLAAIRGAGEILAEQQLTLDERQRFAANILAESQRLERLVSGLLTLARAERESPEVHRPVELGVLVDRLVDLHRPGLAEHRTSIEVSAVEPLPQPRGDHDEVARIMNILIENAIEHTPPDGTILIRVGRTPNAVTLAVEDSGAGVLPADREQIFDRWFALAGESRQGTGLGLAIARSIVERLGGSISVSDSELGGAAFTLELPLANEPAQGNHHR